MDANAWRYGTVGDELRRGQQPEHGGKPPAAGPGPLIAKQKNR